MNKDVIYIEPEDDITDIITKIENSKEKIVALVPPKKAGVFRSVVNIKLIAKVGFTADKTIVLVTTDPSITKLAGATEIPVTKNLQTPPSVPNPITGEALESSSKEELVEEENGEVSSEEVKEEVPEKESEKEEKEDKKEEEGTASESKVGEVKEKAKKAAGAAKKFSFAWLKAHRTLSICSAIGVLLVIIFFIWAFAIAPAATITVGIRTTATNFSKSATFTKKVEEENIDEGKFFLTEKKTEKEASVEFEATGQKNVGEKAKGSVNVKAQFGDKGSVTVKAGDKFTLGEHSYAADADTTISWDGVDYSVCLNQITKKTDPCVVQGTVKVTATESGTSHNIAASAANWKSSANVTVQSSTEMAGGTDQMVTVVSKEDVENAKNQLVLNNEAENKEALMDSLAETDFPIESSFTQTTSDIVSTPAIGEQIKDGETPKITIKITDTIYLIDKTKVEEFITNEAKLSDNFKIYQMNDPFVENFMETSEGFSGKIKTSYVSGPKVTENDVIEIVKGKGLGNAQHDLKDVDGVSKVDIKTSFPWVMNIPGDSNKITVILEVEQK